MASCLTLKKSNCRNCHKCIRNCPVKSIRFSGNQAHILEEECILCGRCFVVCPQGAKEIKNDRETVKVLLQDDAPVIASLAPSFAANYNGVGIDAMRSALKKLGFTDVEETAVGATIVKREYDRLLAEGKADVLISSCCHSANLLIRKHFPSLLPYLAPVLSPMLAHAQKIKRHRPDAKVVFIGPCVAKKEEAKEAPDLVDATLTFEDLTEWMQDENIRPEEVREETKESRARFFPTGGGILKTMTMEADQYEYLVVDGTRNCINVLRELEQGNIHHCFIEMSVCSGSCVGGPVMEKKYHSPVKSYLAVATYAGEEDFPVEQPEASDVRKDYRPLPYRAEMPTEEQLTAILREMGKTKPEDELNCGSCGYDTCREKAVAIHQGKAEVSMCLPFLRDRAESFSNTILDYSPNGLIVVNTEMEVQQINRAALSLLRVKDADDVLGMPLIRILDPLPFVEVLDEGKSIHNRRQYLTEQERYVEETIVPVEDGRLLLCILRDITFSEKTRLEKEELGRQTVEVADQVVDRQMRIVQEIASLLGETAAETKIALTKLKESIVDE